jgi:hypothetical protein
MLCICSSIRPRDLTFSQANHFFFHKYEPASAKIPVILLALEPPALLSLVGGPLTFARLLWTYFVFLATLGVSIALYRLSPFHPLAEYPGPAISKVTRLWDLYKALYGYKYLYHKELHDKYGPYVRVGRCLSWERRPALISSSHRPQ